MKRPTNSPKALLLYFLLFLSTATSGQTYVNISTQPTCIGGNLGAIELSFTPSILNDYPLPYIAEWENLTNGDYEVFQVEQLITTIYNLEAGEYEIIIQLSAECELSLDVIVEEEQLYIADYVNYELPCSGEATGSLTVVPIRGEAPYTFRWSNGSTMATAENLGAGWYDISLTDANGCRQEESISLLEKEIIIEANVLHLCSDEGDINEGAIEIQVSGTGTEPHTYLWSTGATTADISDLYAGIYTLTVSDADGCTKAADFNISEKEITLFAQIQHSACEGSGSQATGSIQLQVGGTGTPPFSYQWSNGATTTDIDQLIAGIYDVTVTDTDGCEQTQFFELEAEGRPVIIDVYTIPSFCYESGGIIVS